MFTFTVCGLFIFGSLRIRMTGMVRTGMGGRYIQYFAIQIMKNSPNEAMTIFLKYKPLSIRIKLTSAMQQ